MITKQLISSLFFVTILVVRVQQGVSLTCYECSSDDEKSDCWVKFENLTKTECGGSNPTESTPTPEVTTQPPATQPPATQPSATQPPATQPSATQPPVTQPPATQPPVTQPPATQPPATQPPATQPPATQPPATQPPATQPPVTQPPATQPPVTQPPATQPPATQPPVTQPPVTQPPVTQPPVTQPPATQPPATQPPGLQKIFNSFANSVRDYYDNSSVKRSKRDTTEWECAKIITKNGEKKLLERKCVKKTDETCKNKSNDSDNKCALCSDKNLCNSTSNLKLQLIPAFLFVFLALFLSSQ